MSENIAYIETLRFRKHQVIFREGEASDRMYTVEEGRVGIVANYGESDEKLLTEIEAGKSFGEMGMIRGLPRSATAVALISDTVVSSVTWATLGDYFRQSPAKVVGIMQQMGTRIQTLSEDYIAACGAVEELSGLCDSLVAENKHLKKELSRAHPEMKTETRTDQAPVWEYIVGERKKSQDTRFKKYIEEYRVYKNAQRRGKI